ncbi:abortive infection bacteriophage resistance protein, partial [Lachnospiraceae bacterium PM6-15]|uniref:Abi family protein n=1 Tax=Ohessyouella blattaphilus TaxID=2949333 RepID=UPI003E23C04B
MSNRDRKPKMSSEKLIKEKCPQIGITFNHISEEEAIALIKEKNNFLRMAAYRKNYRKQEPNKGNGKHYINLDFSYLYELSLLDMYLRHIITRMCIDVEHALKVSLIQAIEEDDNEDGYEIVKDYIAGQNDQGDYVLKSLCRKSTSSYTGSLICKNFTVEEYKEDDKIKKKITRYDDCPAWVFVEVLSFGEFLQFYSFAVKELKINEMDYKVLNQIRSLRNGCAHNNCLIANLADYESNAPKLISNAVSKMENISPSQRRKKLRN